MRRSSKSTCEGVIALCFFLLPSQGHLKDNEPPSSWGPVELVAVIAGPVFLVFVVVIIVVFVFHHHQRVYHNRQRLDMEDPSCEMCLSKDKTLQDLVYDLSTSGSGSGKEAMTGNDQRGRGAGAGSGSACRTEAVASPPHVCCPITRRSRACLQSLFHPRESLVLPQPAVCWCVHSISEPIPGTLRETRVLLVALSCESS